MSSYDLKGTTVAILATDGYEQSELTEPLSALEDAGATVHIVSPKSGAIHGWTDGDWGESRDVDVHVNKASVDNYEALVLPGGVMNPDKLRRDEHSIEFVRQFFVNHKPVAAICHGPQVLIDAGVLEGRRLTSFHSIKQDLINAGAHWVDEEVVCDQGLVTSRTPADLPAFNDKMLEEIAEGRHAGQTV